MRRLLCAAVLIGAAFAMGCSSPCDALEDVCKKCQDAQVKTSCEQTVATYRNVPVSGNSGCQAVLDAKTYDSCK